MRPALRVVEALQSLYYNDKMIESGRAVGKGELEHNVSVCRDSRRSNGSSHRSLP